MSKSGNIYVCRECGYESPRWEGQCRECHKWNTLEEVETGFSGGSKLSYRSRSRLDRIGSGAKPKKLSSINPSSFKRISTKIGELDRALSGGFVPGQVILLSGTPGVGKSTLLLQLAGKYDGKVLYVSGEESETQTALRAERLGINMPNVDVLSSNSVEDVVQLRGYGLVIIDSIQTMQCSEISSQAGSVSQVRGSASLVINYVKDANIPCILVGHITKGGAIAGPKVLEHIVDTVLYMEGDRNHIYRMLKVHKNRFGSDTEVGILEMDSKGLKDVKNYSDIFHKSENLGSQGVAYGVALEGSRPIIIEVQALTVKTAFGYPRRAVSGYSLTRLQLLCAVMQKYLHINLLNKDVYVNITSGFQVKEPAIDHAVCAAILSSYKEKMVRKSTVFIGEVGLSGEIRSVIAQSRRISEARVLGLKNIMSSENTASISQIVKSLI